MAGGRNTLLAQRFFSDSSIITGLQFRLIRKWEARNSFKHVIKRRHRIAW